MASAGQEQADAAEGPSPPDAGAVRRLVAQASEAARIDAQALWQKSCDSSRDFPNFRTCFCLWNLPCSIGFNICCTATVSLFFSLLSCMEEYDLISA